MCVWQRQNALGKITKIARAVEPLIAALKDSDGDVRRYAARALGQINKARGVEPLIAMLKDVNGVSRARAYALGKIKDAARSSHSSPRSKTTIN